MFNGSCFNIRQFNFLPRVSQSQMSFRHLSGALSGSSAILKAQGVYLKKIWQGGLAYWVRIFLLTFLGWEKNLLFFGLSENTWVHITVRCFEPHQAIDICVKITPVSFCVLLFVKLWLGHIFLGPTLADRSSVFIFWCLRKRLDRAPSHIQISYQSSQSTVQYTPWDF